VERGDSMKRRAQALQSPTAKSNAEEVRLRKDKQEIVIEAKKQEHERDVNRPKIPILISAKRSADSHSNVTISIIANSRRIFFFRLREPCSVRDYLNAA